MTSRSRLGEALRCSTRMPSRTGSVHARTPGAPSKVKRTLLARSRRSPVWAGSLVMTTRRPRPGVPAWSPPRGVRPRVLRRVFGVRPLETRQGSPQHLVRARVALGDEPRAAARAVEPPLALHARDVAPEVVVGAELAQRGALARPARDLAAACVVGHLAGAAVRAGQQKR